MTVTPSGNGTGTVTSSPAGINCGGECSHGFAEGTSVTVAVIDAGRATDLINSVHDGGVFISVLDPSTPTAQRGIRVDTMHGQAEGETLASLLDRLASGQLRTRVADVEAGRRAPVRAAGQAPEGDPRGPSRRLARARDDHGGSLPHA